MSYNGKTCKNCGHKWYAWDSCCHEPLFNIKKQLEFNLISESRYKEKIFIFKDLQIKATFWGNGKSCIITNKDTWEILGKYLNKNPLKSHDLKSFLRLPKNYKFNEEF